jgi:hypothetical protein
MLKSDVPMIREQAQEMIKSQGLEDIDMGQNQFLQSGITKAPGAIDFRQREVDRLRQNLETTGRDPAFIEKVTLGLDKLYQPVEFGPINFKPVNALGMFSPVPYVPQLTAASGVIGALKNLDNFKNLSPLDQQFILEQAGGNRPMKDAFGYNIRSARGNYADLVSRRALIARNRALFKQPLRAIDLYYQKKEAERAKADRAILDAAFASGQGGSGQDFTGGRYDGADSFETYSKEPTAYSGSS